MNGSFQCVTLLRSIASAAAKIQHGLGRVVDSTAFGTHHVLYRFNQEVVDPE